MATTIVTFQSGDSVDAATKIESLGIVASDKVVSWQQSNSVFVAKITTA